VFSFVSDDRLSQPSVGRRGRFRRKGSRSIPHASRRRILGTTVRSYSSLSSLEFPLIVPLSPRNRLNKIYRESVSEQEILDILRPMIKSYALERNDGEHFGDFVVRKGIIAPTTAGKAFCEFSFLYTLTVPRR